MSLTAVFDQPNAVVELTLDGLQTAGATLFTIERSTDQVNWTPVRGAITLPVTGDAPEVFLDYEFTPGPGVTNYYRVVGKDAPEFIAVGSAYTVDTVNTYDVTPGLPAGAQPGDLLLMAITLHAYIGNPDMIDPPGWILVGKSPGYRGIEDFPVRSAIYTKLAQAGEPTPAIDIVGNPGQFSSAVAQVAAFRNVRLVMFGPARAPEADQPVNTAQIEFPGITTVANFDLVVALGVSKINWTSASPPSPFTLMDDPTVNGTADASLVWAYTAPPLAGPVSSDVFTITGGTHDPEDKRGWSAAFSYDANNAPFSVVFDDDVETPLEVVWLKDPLRPARNMVVQVASPQTIRHASRSGLFDIKGRAEPIEVSEIRRVRSWSQRWLVKTFTELDSLLELFAPGRTLLLHVPARGTLPDCPPWPRNLPGGYIAVGEVAEETAPDAPLPATLTAPVQIVAAPCPDLLVCEPEEGSP